MKLTQEAVPATITAHIWDTSDETSETISVDNPCYENGMEKSHEMVETVKRDPETSIAYLRLQEKLSRSRKEGRKEGDLRRLVTLVCKKMEKNQSMEKIAEDLVEEIETIAPIYKAAEKYAPSYDPELVFEEIIISIGRTPDMI